MTVDAVAPVDGDKSHKQNPFDAQLKRWLDKLLGTAFFRVWPALLFMGGWSTMVCLVNVKTNVNLTVPHTMITVLGESAACPYPDSRCVARFDAQLPVCPYPKDPRALTLTPTPLQNLVCVRQVLRWYEAVGEHYTREPQLGTHNLAPL